jgi:hypothetical protein
MNRSGGLSPARGRGGALCAAREHIAVGKAGQDRPCTVRIRTREAGVCIRLVRGPRLKCRNAVRTICVSRWIRHSMRADANEMKMVNIKSNMANEPRERYSIFNCHFLCVVLRVADPPANAGGSDLITEIDGRITMDRGSGGEMLLSPRYSYPSV